MLKAPQVSGRAVVCMAVALLICLIGALDPAWSDGATRNAIFNGTFVEGVSAFAVLGPGYKAARLSADKSQHAQTLITELIVSCPGMERTFTLYNTYLLQVRPDREYTLHLRIAGTGHIALGAFEYDADGHHIGNSYSDRHVLTPEFGDLAFTYKPSRNATAIRPAVAFLEPPDGTTLDVRARVRSFELPVPADEFPDVCKSWPDYAKEDVFGSYAGLSEADLHALRELEQADEVLPPYQPISPAGPGAYALTTSRIRFGASALPEGISVLDREILARPIELAVTCGDGTRMVPAGDAVEHVAPQRVDLAQPHSSGALSMSVGLAMHYDALLIYTLEFPAAPGGSVSAVELTLPLTEAVARYISYDRSVPPDAPEERGWVFGYGPIPAQGEKVETKAVVGSAHMGGASANDWKPDAPAADGVIREWTRDVPQTVWIGDETRGISLVSLSQEGYRVGEGDVAARLVRRGSEVALTYRLITRPVSLDKGRRLQFALQVMPPKPIREDWLAARFNSVLIGYPEVADQALPLLEERLKPGYEPPPGTIRRYLTFYDVIREQAVPEPWQARPHRQYRDTGFLWYSLWALGARPTGQPVGGCSTPLVGNPERLARLVKLSDVIGHRGLPYLAATHIAAEDPAGYYYVEKTDEWTAHPRVSRPPYLRPTCPNSLFSAYIARGVGKLIDDYGITGIYFDNCAPFLCSNTRHGCGYVDDDGVLQPTLPLLGFRKLFMMVRAEFVKRGKEPFILTHAGLHPGAVSFTDVELQGEGTYGSDHTEMLTLGEWRARWQGRSQCGVQMSYLPAFGYGLGPDVNRAEQEKIGTLCLLAMALLHGTQVWSQYIDTGLLYRVWEVLDELDEPGVVFTPYWEWPGANEPLNPLGVWATAYRGKDRVLVALSNLSPEAREVSLPLAQIAAQTGAVTQVADNMHGLPVSVEGGVVRCAVGAKDFRLLSFTR